LTLNNTRISDTGLPQLTALQELQELQLSNNDITDAGLAPLKELRGLKQLSLAGTNVTAAGVADLQRALPKCSIWPTPAELRRQPMNVALWPLGAHPTRAELLKKIAELGGQVTEDQGKPHKPITHFMLFDSDVSDESLVRIVAEMPELEVLNLRNLLVGDDFLRRLPALSRLSFIHMQRSRLTNAGLEYLAKYPALRTLEIGATRVSDEGLPHLKRLELEEIDVGNTRMSCEGASELQQVLPNCRVRG
jgi:hypothetical protein